MNNHGILTTEPQELKFIEDPAIQLLREIVRQNGKIIQYLTREQVIYTGASISFDNSSIKDSIKSSEKERMEKKFRENVLGE